MSSPYSTEMRRYFQDLETAFTNEFRLIQPFKAEDVLPGERYGILSLESLDTGDRLDLQRTTTQSIRRIRQDCVFRYQIMLIVGVDCTGLDDYGAQREVEIQAHMEMLDLDHGINNLVNALADDGYGFVADVAPEGAIDRAIAQNIRDPDTYLLTITTGMVVKFFLNTNPDGTHNSPIYAQALAQ